jgi:predicted chitinase
MLNTAMRLAEVFPEDELMEGPFADRIKRTALGGMMAAGLGVGAAGLMPPAGANIDRQAMDRLVHDVINQPPEQKKSAPQASPAVPKPMLSRNTANELLLAKTGYAAGLRGLELAAFLAQCAHESTGFNNLRELGGEEYLRNMYDPKHAPKTAAILGNTKPGDGVRFAGRGFIQLTGRDNYRMAGDALGLPLLKKPELAAKPEIAAKIAVWYWKTRVRPHVRDFTDTVAVTRLINPALKHLDDRRGTLAYYHAKM